MKMRLILVSGTPQKQGECANKEYITLDIEVDDTFRALRAHGFGVIGAEWLE